MRREDWDPQEELQDRLAVISLALEHFEGVSHVEHLLVGLLDLLEGGRVARDVAVRSLVALIEPWPGAPEVLEFCMRALRWPEVKEALQEHLESGADFRTRNMARTVLEAYEDHWPGGEIYRTYRSRP